MIRAEGWQTNHGTTVSAFNSTHPKAEREYFDRPILCPETGYSHVRKDKFLPFAVYQAPTPVKNVRNKVRNSMAITSSMWNESIGEEGAPNSNSDLDTINPLTEERPKYIILP